METSTLIIGYIKENISPKADDISFVAEKYEKVCSVIGNSSVFQSGSYSRNTALRPVNDLDIIKVVPEGSGTQVAESVLQQIHDLLDTEEARNEIGYKKLKLQKSSIGIYFSENEDEFSVDVVPAIETSYKDNTYSETIYIVPEIQKFNKRKRLRKYANESYQPNRIYSAPRSYKSYAKDLDEKTNETFRYFVRFVKQRRRSCKTNLKQDFWLKSFHLEQICAKIVDNNNSLTLYQFIFTFFDQILNYVNSGKQFIDLAYEGSISKELRYIDEYIEDTEKNTNDFKSLITAEVYRVQKILAALELLDDKAIINEKLDTILNGQLKVKNDASQKVNLSDRKGLHGGV